MGMSYYKPCTSGQVGIDHAVVFKQQGKIECHS